VYNVKSEATHLDTNYTEKATRLMQRAARTTALVIVPLAAAVNAHAGFTPGGPVLPTGSPACIVSDLPSGSASGCSGGAFGLVPLGLGGLGGASLFNTGTPLFSGGGTAQLILSATGPLTGGPLPDGTVIPLAYLFDLDFLNGGFGGNVSSWNLDFQLLDGRSIIGDSGIINNTAIDNDAINSDGQDFSGTSSMTTTSLANLSDTLTEMVTLNVAWSAGDSDQLIVQVPAISTFDFDSTNGTSSVPEPGTMIPVASTFALAGFYLIKRKKGWTLTRSER
jgi:hypothetical protein